jgi:hypothetical protein
MHAHDWFSQGDVSPFEVLDLAYYNWCADTITHRFVKPRHHLSVSCGGNATFNIMMTWSKSGPQELHSECKIVLKDGRLCTQAIRYLYDGLEDLRSGERAAKIVGDADRAFGLRKELGSIHKELFLHYVRSKLEAWRRMAESHAEKEAEFERTREDAVNLSRAAKNMAANSYSSHQDLEAHRLQMVTEELRRSSDEGRTLAMAADDASVEVEKLKAMAVEAVIHFSQMYPDVTLPMTLEQAMSMQENGSRLGL